MRIPALWAGMGRTANNISAVLITNFSIALLVSDDRFATVIAALVLFMAVSVVMFVYINRRNNMIKNTLADKSVNKNRGEYSQKFAEAFSLTQREREVFERLISTEESVQEMADVLYMSRRTLQRYIASIYEKTGTKSRLGLYRLYVDYVAEPQIYE